MLKEVYADGVLNLIPTQDTPILERVKDKFELLGKEFVDSIILSDEQGVTYEGEGLDAPASLEDSINFTSADPRIEGCQMTVKSGFSFKAVLTAQGRGPKAFASAVEEIYASNARTHAKRLEKSYLYGRRGLGKLASSANIGATSTAVVITAKSFGAGLFVGNKNAKFTIWDGNTQVEDGGGGVFTLTAFDLLTRTLTLSGVAADITELDTAIAADPDVLDIYHLGAKLAAGAFGECLGLEGMIRASSTLFGVTVQDLHKGNVYDANNADFDFAVLTKALVPAMFYGVDGDLVALVSPAQMQKLNRREVDPAVNGMQRRNYDSKKVEKGSEKFVYRIHGRWVEVLSHPMVKDENCFIIPMDKLKRVGARKESLINPLTGEIEIIQRENRNVGEIKSYSDQALYIQHVSWFTLIEDLKVSDLYA
jgi:hypothetical protein